MGSPASLVYRSIVRLLALALMALTLVAGLVACASRPSSTGAADNEPVVAVARRMLGEPYEYGGARPGGFDCSGLVAYTHERAGKQVPRTVEAQLRAATSVPADALEPGDLVFYRFRDKPAHVGIYAGGDTFIHAPSSGGVVHRSDMTRPFWRQRFITAGRL